jgi:hypothetical protein
LSLGFAWMVLDIVRYRDALLRGHQTGDKPTFPF